MGIFLAVARYRAFQLQVHFSAELLGGQHLQKE